MGRIVNHTSSQLQKFITQNTSHCRVNHGGGHSIEEKQVRYKSFVKDNLSIDFEYETASRLAKQAIEEFGEVEFGHHSYRSVAATYITPPMKEIGEPNDIFRWVWSDTYQELTDAEIAQWMETLRAYNVKEEKILNAFYTKDIPEMKKLR